MHSITFGFLDQYRHGTAFQDYLKLRKIHFVDELGWDVPHNDAVEMDQYDNPCAYYSLVLDNGRVVGGARVMATTACWGSHSYMLRDALRGCIDGIPVDVLKGEIVSDEVWECTRLVVSDRIRDMRERLECLSLIVGGLVNLAGQQGAMELLALTRPALARALRRVGYPVLQEGVTYYSAADNCDYAVLRMPVMQEAMAIAAE